MSSPPAPPASTTYWCHECDMSILLSPTLPPRCPHCQNCSLQHMDTFPPIGPQQPTNIWAPEGHNFLLNRPYLHHLIHHHLTTGAGGGGNFYDPPTINPVSASASRTTIESLKTVRIEEFGLVECCSICKDEFRVESVANELPCGHVFHNECIVPWLEINNTCPLCRFRLESEEEEVEEAYVGAMRLDELLDDGDEDGDYENEFRELMRIERGGGRVMLSPTQIGEAGTGGVVDRANSVETVSSWPVWQAEGEREVGTSDVENVVRA